MDRDIEQAADAAQSKTENPTPIYYQWPPTGENPGTYPPTSRGDATQPDPAVIEATARALWQMNNPKRTPETWLRQEEHVRELYRKDARIAAAVIVPATAEHIAAAIDAKTHQYSLGSPGRRSGMHQAALIARSFAAGLPAGATGGDSDE